ncbi:MAG: ABC transporter ATP-binding protein [Candidatus Lokiarchaeia archaeon]
MRITDYIIQTIDITKKYNLKGHNKQITALNRVNISIKEGEIFGLLGPNGAGKTTLISILSTLAQPTSGYALIDGYNILKQPKKAKERVALMLGSDMLYFRITAYDNLKFFCKIYKVPNYKEKINEMAKELGLDEWLNQYVENFSSGMKMKLALCKTMLLNRKILILDEPTLGLDIKTISFIVNKLKELKKTIFLTSHDMSVVEQLCHRIAFINKGNILKIGSKKELKDITQNEIIVEIEINKDKNQLKSTLTQQNFIKELEETNHGLNFVLTERIYYKNLFSILRNYSILAIKEQELSLGELFLRII